MVSPGIIHSFSNAPGFDEAAFTEVHRQGAQVVSIRLNPAKPIQAGGLSFPTDEKVPWCENGYYLEERPFFTFEPLLHAGAFYVQEASSMFLEQALKQLADPAQPLTVLDLCAAPGGKSTHLQSLLHPGSTLVSNEVIRARAGILEENLVKWGGTNCIITNNDPRDFTGMGGFFDVIVVDAPCSGSGMFRRDPATAEGWSADLVSLCSERQQRILADIWPALKEEGLLVYSTCSYSVEEDEAISDWLLAHFETESLSINIDPSWNIVESISATQGAKGYRFYPDKLKGEGLYLAAFRKTGASVSPARASGKPKWEMAGRQVRDGIRPWLNRDDLSIISIQQNLVALPPQLLPALTAMQQLYIKGAGVTIGRWTGRELVPDHALALSGLLSSGLQKVELDRETALQYLRREELKLPGTQTGWTLVDFAGQSLGWIKRLPNRINNYYPREWRILKPA